MSLDLKVDSIDAEARAARLVLSEDTLVLLNNALNEVCNGVDIDEAEFATRLGADRDEACALLGEFARILDALDAGAP